MKDADSKATDTCKPSMIKDKVNYHHATDSPKPIMIKDKLNYHNQGRIITKTFFLVTIMVNHHAHAMDNSCYIAIIIAVT